MIWEALAAIAAGVVFAAVLGVLIWPVVCWLIPYPPKRGRR